MTQKELKEFLDEKADRYNRPEFIEADPIQIPHHFTRKEDIEIAGFLAATLAWGNRKMIVKSAQKLMHLMGNAPHDFVLSHSETHLERLDGFVHRTFNATDARAFVKALQNIYLHHGGLEMVLSQNAQEDRLQNNIHNFRNVFWSTEHEPRSEKHVSDPRKNSAAKRINMFLRWMVRNDQRQVDLGIWKRLSPAQLSCPLDVHSGRVARKLGLLSRKQNDALALEELDFSLRQLDPTDPVRYDFALFGLGVFEGF